MLDIERFEQFSRLLSQITRELTRIKTKYMSRYGLGSTHLMCIISLRKNEGQTAGDLVAGEEVDKAQLSRVLSELCAKSFVEPVPGQSCKYRKKYQLTDEGMKIADEVSELTKRIIRFVDKGLNGEQIKIMYEALAVINKNLAEVRDAF
jgi:DNA-binding MarR family transcriptional regulator